MEVGRQLVTAAERSRRIPRDKIDWTEVFGDKPDPSRVLRAAANARTETLALTGRGVDVVMARPKGALLSLERP